MTKNVSDLNRALASARNRRDAFPFGSPESEQASTEIARLEDAKADLRQSRHNWERVTGGEDPIQMCRDCETTI